MEQQRVFLAIALSIGVLLIWQYFFAPPPPVVEKGKQAVEAPAEPGQGDKGQAPVANSAGDKAAPTPPKPVKVIPQKDVSWEMPGYQAVFTNKGGRLKSFVIREPKQYTPRQNLLQPEPEENDAGKRTQEGFGDDYLKYLPLALTFSGRGLQLPEDALYEVTAQEEGAATFLYTDPQGQFTVQRQFTADKDKAHTLQEKVTVTSLRSQGSLEDELNLVSYLQNVEDSGGFLSMGYLSDPAESICHAEGGVERAQADDASENPKFQGPVRWGGVNSRYFMLASIPQEEPMKSCNFDLRQGEFIRTALVGDTFRLEPGQSHSWSFTHYVGPKNVDVMESFGVEMEDSVDFGIFAFLCKPIHWLLIQLYSLVGNWGIAIILLTIILRTLTFPINHKSYKNMEGMRRVNEPLQEIKKRYEGNSDPQAQMQMQQEMMELYKKEGVNPLGCLPTFLQMPIFFALYRTIYGSVELYQADFFGWYTDLSSPDPYFILPVLVGAVMVGQQFLMPSSGMENPQMKIMMWIMPVMFFFFSLMMPSGLALYMFISISLGIAQQAYIRKSVRGNNEPTIVPAS